MKPKLERKIRRLAYKVRDAVECIANQEHDEHKNYRNSITTMAGMCARASAMLSFLLEREEIEHQIVYGHGHVYIECQNYILDTTATQFGDQYGKTLIRPIHRMKGRGHWWKTSIRFSSVDHLMRWQKTESWPWQQCAVEDDLDFL